LVSFFLPCDQKLMRSHLSLPYEKFSTLGLIECEDLCHLLAKVGQHLDLLNEVTWATFWLPRVSQIDCSIDVLCTIMKFSLHVISRIINDTTAK